MAKYATLCLGSRQDAATWNAGCERLGMTQAASVRAPTPSLSQIKDVFASAADWVYFGGHFVGGELYNEGHSLGITFRESKVEIKANGTTETIERAGKEFKLTEVKVVLWGGCSVCSSSSTIKTMRRLFGNHVMLGFASLTGWQMVDAMLGGGFIKRQHFFANVGGAASGDLDLVAMAWMDAAKWGYGGGPNESKFRAIKQNGQELKLEKGAIVDGRNI
ncbi:MAG: hypothetical protein VBE63_26320 [Lamprobacter sp.]|uniref:hypothetical protein n=1 Tax=Lamprobacter sp. TaxID=3100796 RepID=UPI002B26004D|nr:hypothetical protein [Lamprobacter sp.]MEA3643420.1 hypothetical protein [Lamprobacter sp.]